MRFLFVNKYDEVRSGWKILLVYILYWVLYLGFAYVGRMAAVLLSILNTFALKNSNDPLDFLFGNPYLVQNMVYLGLTISMFFAIFIICRGMEGKRWKDIGFISVKLGVKDLGIGLSIGALSMTGIFLVLLATGNIQMINGFAEPYFSSAMLWGILFFIMVGIQEEIFSRGYVLSVLEQTRIRWVPAVVSALIFSFLHGNNPNVSWLGLVNIFLVGLLFAYMTIRTRNIWMAIGYHITWNYFQGHVFSFPVSGLAQEGIYQIRILNNNLLTGGDFGPEGGILATIAILIGFLVIGIMAKSQEQSL